MNPALRYHLRKWTKSVGLGPGNYRPNMEGVARHFRSLGFVPQTIIDVGVAHGTYELYRTWPMAKLVLVEPMREFRSECQYICARHGNNSQYFEGAAGNQDGTTPLFFSTNIQGASLLPSGQAEHREVAVCTLDSLCESAPSPFLLKIDVQGAEMTVLDGAEKILTDCEVVMLETALFNFNRLEGTIVEVIARMKALGFVPFDFYDAMPRPLDKSLGQIDVAFVKQSGQFRTSMEWGTPRQSRFSSRVHHLRNLAGI